MFNLLRDYEHITSRNPFSFHVHLNVEIKAKCTDHSFIRNYLLSNAAEVKGTDYQRDIYFSVPNGRLKLRQGNIENALIYYDREDKEGPKSSWVNLYPVSDSNLLESILERALGVKNVVEKQREIYFIDNVKFHLDVVSGLGKYVEIEAIDSDGNPGLEKLQRQCEYYLNSFAIKKKDLVKNSYSDMIPGK